MTKTSVNAVSPDANNAQRKTITSSGVAGKQPQPLTANPNPKLAHHFAQSTHPPDTHPISYSQSNFQRPFYNAMPF